MANVSIIMPAYNSGKYISRSIESIISQEYQDYELLITDDASIDDTVDVIEDYKKKDNRIKLFRLKNNSGAGVARNKSIRCATGRYIAFCDSDDQWFSEKLNIQISFMREKKLPFTFTGYEVINDSGLVLKEIKARSMLTYEDMLKNNYIGCLTAVYDTSYIGKMYMPEIKKRQDWALWLSILKKINYAVGIQEKLATYQERSNSISSNKLNLLKYNWLIYSDYLGYSAPMSIYYMIRFIYYYFNR